MVRSGGGREIQQWRTAQVVFGLGHAIRKAHFRGLASSSRHPEMVKV
jgi:hypothetical protein